MVSNHGARQLDGVSATIDALEEIANIGTNHLLQCWQFLHLADALLQHFLEGIDLLRDWYINPKSEE